MARRSWTTRLPRAYEVVMAPLEAVGFGRLRSRLRDGLPAAGRGLEIGAGSTARDDAAAGPETIRTDISPAMLRRGRAKRGSPLRLAAADVQALPFADATFDFVAGALLFCEVPDPERGLREVRRVLRPGGTLHLLEHVRPRGALLDACARALTLATGPLLGEHFDRSTHETVVRAGFTIERIEWRLRGAIVLLVARRQEE